MNLYEPTVLEESVPSDHGVRVETFLLAPNGSFPNNPRLPVLVYRDGFPSMASDDLESSFRALFESNGWSGCWRSSIHHFHHYHSRTHEVMGVCAGAAGLELGGPHGQIIHVTAGDVLLLPAGTAHRKASSTADFEVVGAYPGGKGWNMCYGTVEELVAAQREISRVPLPKDPVFDNRGPVFVHWKNPVADEYQDAPAGLLLIGNQGR